MRGLGEEIFDLVILLIRASALKTEEAYELIKPKIKVYLKLLLLITVLALVVVPIFVGLKIVTGWPFFGFIGAMLALILTVALGLLWSPLGVILSMLAGKTINPIEAGGKYVRFMAIILFAELMASIYVWRVPFHQHLETVPLLIMSATAVALGSAIWGGFVSGRFYTLLAAIITLLTTLSFFLPETYLAGAKKFGGIDHKIAEAMFASEQPRSATVQQLPKPRIIEIPAQPQQPRSQPERTPTNRREPVRRQTVPKNPSPYQSERQQPFIPPWQGQDRVLTPPAPRPQREYKAPSLIQQLTPQQWVVPIQPDEDSEKITIPSGKRFDFNSPGSRWLEFRFPNGERIRVDDRSGITKITAGGMSEKLVQFPDTLPSNTFWLRGDGNVVILTLF